MPNQLPAAAAEHGEVGKSKIELSGVAFVSALEVFKAGYDGNIAITMHPDLTIANHFRFQIAGGEHRDILFP